MPPIELILASASPRRQELIALLGLPFRIIPSGYVEPAAPNTPVLLPDFVQDLAMCKAMEVAERMDTGLVLGADTEVSIEELFGIPLGKPKDLNDARRMLRILAGRDHYVYTGVALVPVPRDAEHLKPISAAVKTRVRFRALTDAMIDDYVATGEPMDKAGAYGAQGAAAPFIESFEGDFYNVVGLPLCETGKLLEQIDLEWWRHRNPRIKTLRLIEQHSQPESSELT